MFAIKLDRVDLPTFITPGLALGIWFIASYTYLAYLHRYWEMNVLEKRFHQRFGTFLVGDLVLRFRSPFALLPAIVLLIVLIAILASNVTFLLLTIMLVVPVCLVLGWMYVQRVRNELRDEEEKIKSKSPVDENWTSLKKRINQELENMQWIDAGALSDIAMVRGIDVSALGYAFAKYAAENAAATKHAHVCRRSDRVCVSGYTKVLINLQNLNRDNYYYRDSYWG